MTPLTGQSILPPAALPIERPSSIVPATVLTQQFKELVSNHMEQILSLGLQESSSLILICTTLIEELSNKNQCDQLVQLITNFTDHFHNLLPKLPQTPIANIPLIKKEAKWCCGLIKDMKKLLFENEDYKNQKIEPNYQINQTLLSWNRVINHFRAVANLSPTLQNRIQLIADKNFKQERDALILTHQRRFQQRFNTFQERLKLLFGNRFVPLVFLGKGSFKTAYLSYELTTKTVVAISICLFASQVYSSSEKELSLKLSGLPGIIRTHEVKEISLVQKRPAILQAYVQEFMDDNLFEFVQSCYTEGPAIFPLNRSNLEALTLSLIESLVTLEENQVVHLDVREDNILYCLQNNQLIIKLMDFGFAQNPNNPQLLPKDKSFSCMPPDAISNPDKCITSKSDIYSMGFILYKIYYKQITQLLSDIKIYDQKESLQTILDLRLPQEQLVAKQSSKWFPNLPLPIAAQGTIIALIWQMIQKNPTSRPTPKQALATAKALFAESNQVKLPQAQVAASQSIL